MASKLLQENAAALEDPEVAAAIQYSDDPEGGVGWLSHGDLSRTDDPRRKRELVAEEMGVPLEDVMYTPEGDLAYKSEDGQYRLAQPSGFWNRAEQYSAEAAGNSGAIVGSILGAPAGIPGVTLGAGLGDLAQSGLENLFEDRGRGLQESGMSAATEGALAMIPDVLYAGGKSLVRGAKNKAIKFGEDELAAGMARQEAAQARGINLTPAEAMRNPEMLEAQSILSGVPNESATLLRNKLEARSPAIEKAVDDFTGPTSPQERYRSIHQTLGKNRKGLEKSRADASAPLYERAGPTYADIQPMLESLDARIAEVPGGKRGKYMRQVRRTLLKGNPKDEITVDTIEQLQWAKEELDDQIETLMRGGEKKSAAMLLGIKRELMGVMQTASDDFALANSTYKAYSKPINKFDATLPGQLVKDAEKPTSKLGHMIFGTGNSPEAVARMRQSIDNDDRFTQMALGWIKEQSDEINMSPAGDSPNLGGLLFQRTFGNSAKQARMKAALPEDVYADLENFMEVLADTGRRPAQSATAMRTESMERLKPGSWLSPRKSAENWFKQREFDARTMDVTKMLTDPYTLNDLAARADKIRQLGATRAAPMVSRDENAAAAAFGIAAGNAGISAFQEGVDNE